MHDERRKHRRRATDAAIRLYSPAFGAMTGRTRNIADGGFFVALEALPDLSPGETLKAVLPESRNPAIVFNLQLVRLEADGIALKVIDYEVNGEMRDIHELRKQWHAQKTLAK